ncbi:hypothetical protein PFISCL1PPCAC_6071, partial [Pristionchus fissidentatus]
HNDHFVLSFAYVFEEPQKVFFAYSIPYTYSKLKSFLSDLESRQFTFFRRRILTETIQKREVDLVTIEDESAINSRKKMIFITGRVHPGETPSSHVIHGLIQFLVSDDPKS